MDCGPTCLRMIAKYYGRSIRQEQLRSYCQISKEGVSLLGISEAAERIGLRTLAARITFDQLQHELILPCIVYWKQSHFIVVYKVSSSYIFVADPAHGKLKLKHSEFMAGWSPHNMSNEGIGAVLAIEPTLEFKSATYEKDNQDTRIGVRKGIDYLLQHRQMFFLLLIGLLLISLFQVVTPFLAQAIVDVGIATSDMNLVMLILLGQAMILVGMTVMEFLRSWTLLHVSGRINLTLLTDFFVKLMKLPLSYFDVKQVGDISQRMNDHRRIESFMSGTLVSAVFALVNFVVFTFLIISYDVTIFVTFLIGNLLYFLWIFMFAKVRKKLDYQKFDNGAEGQNATIEIIQGMQEIRLNNCEKTKRWKWEMIQARAYRINIRSMVVDQIQQGGALFINQGRNIITTFLTAKAVIDGRLTLGGMVAIQYIIGQLNSPFQQMIQLTQSLQFAKISLDRVNEIHALVDEEQHESLLSNELPSRLDLTIRNLHFKYPGAGNEDVLQNLNILIPQGKTTAIVGLSGSGKTTLLKLLLKIYNPTAGDIKLGNGRLSDVNSSVWRRNCGVVMQDGYIFSDTIAANISISDEMTDMERVKLAAQTACIDEFIESLPLGYNTKIGGNGNGISAGQKQRILIARAVYKNPAFIFLDEATNALDAINEAKILDNLKNFFIGKTVVVVAHRLSTVKNANQIVVMVKGQIIEQGTHEELTAAHGNYYALVKEQLALGN